MAEPRTEAPVAERVLDAASEITREQGWGHVTMAKVAGLAGVSRQTVYNEFGAKPGLGQAMVLRELDRFLAVVAEELDAREDLGTAIRSAAQRIFELARSNPLLHTVLTSAHAVSSGGAPGADNELLPFLTTDAGPLIEAATRVITARLDRFPEHGLPPVALKAAVDALVRLVLSHVMQPVRDAAATADEIGWIATRLLAG